MIASIEISNRRIKIVVDAAGSIPLQVHIERGYWAFGFFGYFAKSK